MPSKSKSQQQAAAIALQVKKGNKPKSELWGASKQMAKMSMEDLEKFAKTKHKGLPKRKHKKRKVNEAWGQKLDLYLDIIWRWFSKEGYSEEEIDLILNDPQNMETIQSAEAHGINPILAARELKTENVLSESEINESAEVDVDIDEIRDIFFNEYLPENGFFSHYVDSTIDLNDSDAENQILADFSKYMEEEHYDIWDPALESSVYLDLVNEFLNPSPVRENYAPETLEEFLKD